MTAMPALTSLAALPSFTTFAALALTGLIG
jgi:hypothetical protein